MNLFSFTAHFGTEDDCREHFKLERDKIGLTCKCGSTEHFWIKSRLSYECKKCRSRTSLKSGTIMENSNFSFLIWYKTMFLMSVTKKGFSAKEIQDRRQGILCCSTGRNAARCCTKERHPVAGPAGIQQPG